MYDCHWLEFCRLGATVCGGTAASCVPAGTSLATTKPRALACRPESGPPTSLTSLNFTTGVAAAGAAGTVTLVIVATIAFAVPTSGALATPDGPGGPAGPVGPVGPVDPAGPVAPVEPPPPQPAMKMANRPATTTSSQRTEHCVFIAFSALGWDPNSSTTKCDEPQPRGHRTSALTDAIFAPKLTDRPRSSNRRLIQIKTFA